MDFIDDIIQREGGSEETDDPLDAGGRTKYGVSEKFSPDMWKDGPPTYEKTRVFYENRYVKIDGIDTISDVSLMHQVADFGVTAGPETAVKTLQQLVTVPCDGKIGPVTLDAITNYPAGNIFGQPVSGSVLLNLAFRDARALYYIVVTKKRPTNLRFLLGWLKRTFEFK
jgi:lysozyme family protein